MILEMADFYTLKLCGLTRKLPLEAISKNTRIAGFNVLGDVELVEKVSRALADKLRGIKFDYLVGPEVKVVPLIHEMAKKLEKKRYVICRKSIKPDMVLPVILKPLPYFPKHVKPLVIDGADRDLLTGKRVVIVDDVVSTGVTLRMVKKLMEMIGAQVVATVAVIRQGEGQFDGVGDLIYLAQLPIFKK
jgi:adenine phosphoribosyltransferase